MIIALTGYAGSGKSTAAKILTERHGFTLVKFAGPLKQMMRCLGLGDHEIEGDLKEQPHEVLCGKTPRHAMQTLGTEWGRDLIGQELWVNVAMGAAWRVLDQGGKAVIDDCRFLNEAAAVRTEGGIIVEVMRPGVGPQSGHVSENQIPDPDRLIINGGTVEDLALRMAQLIKGERW
jgi:hypothetical protein